MDTTQDLQAEDRYRSLVERAQDGIFFLRDAHICYCNPAGQSLVQAAIPAALIGRPLAQFLPATDRERVTSWLTQMQATGRPLPPLSFRMRSLNARWIDVESSGAPCQFASKPAIQLVFRDVTALKRGERLNVSRSRILEGIATGRPLAEILTSIMEFIENELPESRCSILLLDAAGRHLVHGAAPSLPDFYTKAVDGLEIGSRVGSCGAAAFLKQRVIAEDLEVHPNWEPFRDVARRAGLRACWSEPILSPSREVLGTFAVYHPTPHNPDAIEVDTVGLCTHLASIAISRLRSETALVSSQRMLRTVLDSLPLGIFWKDRDSVYLGGNRRLAQSFGFTDDRELIGKTDYDLHGVTRKQADYFVARDREVMAANEPIFGIIEPATFSDGHTVWLETNKVPLRDANEQVIGILGTWQDVTERQHTAEALRQSENCLRTFVEYAPASIAMFDRDIRYLAASRLWLSFFGIADDGVVGRLAWEVVPNFPERWKDVDNRCLQGAVEKCAEDSFTRPDGTVQPLAWEVRPWHTADGEIGGLVIFTEDIAERKQKELEKQAFEERLREAQKLESLGILAGGVAHDFNNILTAILGHAELALVDVPGNSALRSSIEQVISGARRASELTQQMLAYAGKTRCVFQPEDLSALIRTMVDLLRVSVSKKAVLRCRLDEHLPKINADAGQLRQVIMNLIVNASEALEGHDGEITVRTELLRHQLPLLAGGYLSRELPAGDYVTMTVADTGCGMTPEQRARIFDPFFTTKFTGRGLGLAAVLGIVHSHGGAIHVASSPQLGSTFRVWFPVPMPAAAPPASDPSSPPASLPTTAVPPASDKPACTGTVLVVEDEAPVRRLAQRMLEGLGFQVLTADNGRTGLEVFQQHVDQIQVVLLDLSMPELDGQETFRLLRGVRPEVPVVFTSGFGEEGSQQRIGQQSRTWFVAKPYRLKDLQAAVCGALDNCGPS